MAEVAGDFLVNARRMQQGGGAVEECDEGKGQASVVLRGAAKLRGELPLDEIKGWHVLFASEGDGPVFGDEAVIVGMRREEIERAMAMTKNVAASGVRMARPTVCSGVRGSFRSPRRRAGIASNAIPATNRA